MHRLEAVILQTEAPRAPRVAAMSRGGDGVWHLTVDFEGEFGSVRMVDRRIERDAPLLQVVLALLERPAQHRDLRQH
ncbi:MAG: hypothetical protein ACKOWF_13250 [Chloroflexota bacterium]